MLKRIELRNFMSHKHTVIDLASGLTVLVGPNNCGKSAVVAALQILCANDNSTYVQRHGEKECSVRVDTDDGHVIEWHRDKSPYYLIDGKRFDRLKESGMPEEELNRLLRVPKVQTSSEDCDIHFAAQKSPIFLLDKSPAYAAGFFASSSDAVRLVEMQALHRKKAGDARRDKERLESESRRLTAELEALAPTVELERRVDELEHRHEELGRLAKEIQAMAETAQGFARQGRILEWHMCEVEALESVAAPPVLEPTQPLEEHRRHLVGAAQCEDKAKAVQQSLASLPRPPGFAVVEPLQDLLVELRAEGRSLARYQCVQKALEPVQEPPRIHETQMLADHVDRLREAGGNHSWASRRAHEISRLTLPPELPAVVELDRLLVSAHTSGRLVKRWQEAGTALTPLTPPPERLATEPLSELLAAVAVTERALSRAKDDLRRADAGLARAAAELRALAEESAICPTCGEALDPDRMMAHAAAHATGHGGKFDG